MIIPLLDFGGIGAELVFLHANGYPPDCYRPLLSRLAEKYHRPPGGGVKLQSGTRQELKELLGLRDEDFIGS